MSSSPLATPIRTASLGFDNSYARLPERFYARVSPAPMPEPSLVRLNAALARDLGIDPDVLASPAGIAMLGGRDLPADAEPLAMAYAGHQFGHFSPQLGDGRAILLGEIVDARGIRRDLHLKGAGRTPYSRQGDGRAVQGPVLREYLVSEAMHALGIPTTRALAALHTGESVMRERPFPGAIMVRVARSHVRVGTFELFASRGDTEALQTLADYCIARHCPRSAEAPNPALALLDEVLARQAELVARWMHVGFVHGVMNTDNMQIAGETIDYGPCAFMNAHHPQTVFSFIDSGGRYAYGNQPQIAHWNLAQLARALLPIIDPDQERAVALAIEVIDTFPARYERAWLDGMRGKLGLHTAQETDLDLARGFLTLLGSEGADHTLAFRHLCDAAEGAAGSPGAPAGPISTLLGGGFEQWYRRWCARLSDEELPPAERAAGMRAVNPAYIPRNHRVEAVLERALEGDLAPFDHLFETLQRPFTEQPGREEDMQPPPAGQEAHTTYCGT